MVSPSKHDQPDENPFEASVGWHSEEVRLETGKEEDSKPQMPPVEQSYWTGFLALGLLSIATCVVPTLGVAPSFVGPSFALIILLVWFSSCLIFLLPMSLIRLGLHRKNIARAIEQRTYPGGQRFASPKQVLSTHPERVLEMAVRGMLPKGRLGRALFRNLYVYSGSQHPHEGQQPKSIKIA